MSTSISYIWDLFCTIFVIGSLCPRPYHTFETYFVPYLSLDPFVHVHIIHLRPILYHICHWIPLSTSISYIWDLFCTTFVIGSLCPRPYHTFGTYFVPHLSLDPFVHVHIIHLGPILYHICHWIPLSTSISYIWDLFCTIFVSGSLCPRPYHTFGTYFVPYLSLDPFVHVHIIHLGPILYHICHWIPLSTSISYIWDLFCTIFVIGSLCPRPYHTFETYFVPYLSLDPFVHVHIIHLGPILYHICHWIPLSTSISYIWDLFCTIFVIGSLCPRPYSYIWDLFCTIFVIGSLCPRPYHTFGTYFVPYLSLDPFVHVHIIHLGPILYHICHWIPLSTSISYI